MMDILTFFLISEVANGFQGIAPYAMFQAGHFGLGLLSSQCRPVVARSLFVLWVLKEVLFDNLTFGGTFLVAIDSVADLSFGLLGYCLISLARRRWLSDCLRSGVISNRSDWPQNSPKQRLR